MIFFKQRNTFSCETEVKENFKGNMIQKHSQKQFQHGWNHIQMALSQEFLGTIQLRG